MIGNNPTVLACVVAWVVLAGGRRMAEGFPVDAEGKPQAEATYMPLDHRSLQSPNDPKSLDPEELGIFNTSNTTLMKPSSKSSRRVEIFNTTTFNASSSPPSPTTPLILGLQSRKTGERNKTLPQPAQPSRSQKPPTVPQPVDSNTPGPSSVPNLMERIAAKELAESWRYTPVNFSASGDFALPNWERAPRVITTLWNYSRVYRLPSWESSFSLFGVRSSDEVRIALLPNDVDDAPMNITFYDKGGESDIQFNISSASGQVEVSRYSLTLTMGKHTWFTIFRKKHFLSVHVAGTAAPILAYEHPDKNLNLVRYTRFQVWSKKTAHWDLIGKAYQNENKGTSPVDKAMKEELRGIEQGLAERFGLVMNLVGALQRPSVVDDLSLSDIQEIKDMGDSILPLRKILFYYNFIYNKNLHWTSF